jgi:hypothetical protein
VPTPGGAAGSPTAGPSMGLGFACGPAANPVERREHLVPLGVIHTPTRWTDPGPGGCGRQEPAPRAPDPRPPAAPWRRRTLDGRDADAQAGGDPGPIATANTSTGAGARPPGRATAGGRRAHAQRAGEQGRRPERSARGRPGHRHAASPCRGVERQHEHA